jgi:Ca-activated chloride channel family protein
LVVWIVLAGVCWYIFGGKKPDPQPVGGGPGSGGTVASGAKPSPAPPPSGPVVEIGVAYGTEKKKWLEWAVGEFAQTEAGKQIKVQLIPMGSVEAGHAIAQNEGRVGDKRIHVWSPASTLNREVFMSEWELRHSGEPIVKDKEVSLAMTPMVFVMWKARQEAFKTHYPEVTFQSIKEAMEMEGGWGGIAKKPDWGLFKFDHTDPNKSNSGLATLVLMAYDFHNKNKNLTPADIVKPEFQTWLSQFSSGPSAHIESTGTLMEDMVRKGPSTYDAVMVYESVAIDYIRQAEGRSGAIYVVYPKRNIWSDHPYCILNTDWCKPEHKQAAEKFLAFLLSEPIQTKALEHGFRPGNLQVPINLPESPFIKYADHGLKIDLAMICDSPTGEVLNNLIQSWQRAKGSR